MKEVWITDDDQSIRWVLERALTRAGLAVRTFSSAADVHAALVDGLPSVLVTDVRMPGQDGLSLLQQIKQEHPRLPVIVMTAFTDLNNTVAAFQKGAFDYLPKPFDVNAAIALIQRAAQADSNDGAMSSTSQPAEPLAAGRVMMQSSSPAMQEVFRAIGRLAASSVTVLITGESGTGKELIARALHTHSRRASGPFVALNAAAIPKDLLEAELFGHERGAFTGATQQRQGRFEEANGGTLFLDEIGDMPFELQTRLLRVLAEGTFYRIGGSQAIRADVRIVAATHQPLEQRVEQGRFREDLFHRLNVIRLRLPPLRERKEDIAGLAELFLNNSASDLGVPVRTLTPQALQALTAFDYPGNIRQLENFCQWLTVMSSGKYVDVKDLPLDVISNLESRQALPGISGPEPSSLEPGIGLDQHQHQHPSGSANTFVSTNSSWIEALKLEANARLSRNEPAVMLTLGREFEQALLECALAYSRGRKVEAAQRLGIGRNTLTRKFQEFGIGD
jgi:two-component system nitrogen regulation response regulator GlnG